MLDDVLFEVLRFRPAVRPTTMLLQQLLLLQMLRKLYCVLLVQHRSLRRRLLMVCVLLLVYSVHRVLWMRQRLLLALPPRRCEQILLRRTCVRVLALAMLVLQMKLLLVGMLKLRLGLQRLDGQHVEHLLLMHMKMSGSFGKRVRRRLHASFRRRRLLSVHRGGLTLCAVL